MGTTIQVTRLTTEAFAPFGDVLDTAGTPEKLINQGLCERYHDRARLDFGDHGRAGISIFQGQICTLPQKIEMVERHPEGSQTFIPMTQNPFLVVVAPGSGDIPGTPLAFITEPGQAINFHRGTWHGVLTPLAEPGLFVVVDRIGTTPNLEEHWFKTQHLVDY